MNTFALPSLLAFIASFFLGALVYSKNPKAIINRAYLILISIAGIYSFIEYGYCQSQSFEEAKFWWKMDIFWPFLMASLLYFILIFTENNKLIKNKIFNIIVLGTALFLMITEVFTDLITGPPEKHHWGWLVGTYRQDTWAGNLCYIYLFSAWIIVLFTTVRYFLTRTEKRKKQQAGFILISITITVSYTVLDVLRNTIMSEYDFPSPFAFVLVSALGLCAYAIWKYDLFALTPITVAENIVAAMTDTLLLVNTQHRIESCNAAALKMLELSEKELNDIPADKIFDRGRETPSWLKQEDSESEAEQIKYVDTIFLSKRGKRIPVSLASSVLYDNSGRKMGYLMIARDITERNRKEQELTVFKNHLEQLISLRTKELESSLERLKNESKEKKKVEQEREFLEEARASLEEQLYHAQKMESIGCLAGGVAHDFNNLLFVISSYSEAFINETDINDPLYADFKEIHQAATRATALTQQLLAFSRKQIISPVPVDPNEAISQLYKMLVRLIGEHIHFNIIPGINVGQIKIDPVQLDQLLMNLAVNSRDAMPHGGTITVEVNQEVLTPSKSTEMEGVRPGYYVRIRFSDTGIGMDEQTKARIFDPFFTTKAQGKGTGLGLATIYGIVKQNRGFIEVDSRLGEGTAFSLYFPRYEPDIKDSPLPGDFIAPEGDETILLVEDEEQVRRLAARLLRRLGYNVIEAAGAGEATRIFHEHKSNIDLLFTDVVMPDMDGKSLSKLLGVTKPRLKVLFMSGYNEEITDNLGHLNKNISFIAKPFSSDDLSRKIREVLDG